ncbi:MAG: hypothetical protein R3F11_10000 [Verrucomicrobiales bacterium]
MGEACVWETNPSFPFCGKEFQGSKASAIILEICLGFYLDPIMPNRDEKFETSLYYVFLVHFGVACKWSEKVGTRDAKKNGLQKPNEHYEQREHQLHQCSIHSPADPCDGRGDCLLPAADSKGKPITVIGTEAIRDTFDDICLRQALNARSAPGVSELV